MINFEKEDAFDKVRKRMVEIDLKGRGIIDPEVLKVMEEVPREEFVTPSYLSQAYADGPLSIGCSQTISQPYIVALMTEALKLNPDCEILEIGTGSGYQTAILCRLAKKVYTVERFAELSEAAQAVLGRLGIKNVEFHIGDGSCGWPVKRSFERTIVTAAVPKIPEPLFEQLAEGGIIIAPVGLYGVQQLIVGEKKRDRIIKKSICDVRFVKLVGEYGFKE
jgi:protein-L-isoaspartate(D-aspartate) O-methyltransferase